MSLRRLRSLHDRAFRVGCLGAAGLASVLPEASLATQLGLLAVGLALTGLPHGASDWTLGRRLLRPRLGGGWWLAFGPAYLVLAGLVLALWWRWPGPALAGFLLLSMLHFGASDLRSSRDGGVGEILAVGAVPVALPLGLHPEAVLSLFAWLAPLPASLDPALCRWLLLLPAALSLHAGFQKRWGDVTEIVTLGLAAAALPPLLFFALYFCAGHALRHELDLMAELGLPTSWHALGQLGRDAVPVTLATLAMATAATLWLGAQTAIEPLLSRVSFIGLAALTVPHMVLTAAWGGTKGRGLELALAAVRT